MRHTVYLSLCAAALLVAGCNKDAKSIEEREERDPLVKTGQAYMEQQEWDKAIESFKQATENEPLMARPHLDLAVIYQQYKPNYIHAIYHYDRYLELRPDSEKATFINEQKIKVAKALANTLINNSPEVKKVVEELQRLRQENAALKKQIAAKASSSVQKKAESQPKTVTETIPKSTPVAPAAKTHQIYHVVVGDTLTRIAQEFYGDSGKWDVIFEANKDTLNSPGDLRVGQTLVIPNIGN